MPRTSTIPTKVTDIKTIDGQRFFVAILDLGTRNTVQISYVTEGHEGYWLTLEQAEKHANQVLEMVAEIREQLKDDTNAK